MNTAPTVESCHALGVVHGTEFARRELAKMVSPLTIERRALQSESEREAQSAADAAAEHADCMNRQTDLAMRGATLPALEAYTAGRRAAYTAEFEAFSNRLAAIGADTPIAPNRTAKRRAAALARKAKP